MRITNGGIRLGGYANLAISFAGALRAIASGGGLRPISFAGALRAIARRQKDPVKSQLYAPPN